MKIIRRASEKIQLIVLVLTALLCSATWSMAQDMVCWFVPGSDGAKSKTITEALSKGSGLNITPRVASNYPEIFKAFTENKNADLVYGGSFSAALLSARGLAIPLVQKVDGKELYSGVMIYPQGGEPMAILRDNPVDISYAVGASSGESSAKAATGGKASIGVKDHVAATNAVKAGKAKAAFVKNWWWEANKDKYKEFAMSEIPGISEKKFTDNLLMASASIPQDVREKVTSAALTAKVAFGATAMAQFDSAQLDFTLEMMKKGGIDPKIYAW
jgi:ABC-type phosphate/phosphonate transport system substrate-binding protein